MKKIKKLKKLLVTTLIVVLAATSLSACGGGGNDGGDAKKDTMVFGSIWADATSLDPAVDNSSKSMYILLQLYDPLFFYNNTEKGVEPAIADEYKVSDDGLVYTIHIRDNALFHDGNKIKASDVVFSIERAMDSAVQSNYVGAVKEAKEVDESTVEITLKAPFAPFIKYLSGVLIVSEKAVTEMGDKYGIDGVVGSGAYTLKEWKTGEYTLLEAFPDYYLGEAPIKNVKVVGIADTSSMLIALESGEVDITSNLATTDLDIIKDNSDLELYELEISPMFWFLMNNTKFPFDNKLLRQAMNYACDKEAILQAEMNGHGKTVKENFLLSEQSLGYTANDAVANYPYDPEKAKALLKEAGYEDGFEFTANALSGWGENAIVALQENLAKVGIKVNVELIEDSVSFNNIRNLTYQMDVMASNDVFLDADMLYDRYHSKGGNNMTGYSNPKVDKILEQAREEMDEAKRVSLYDEAVAILKEDAVVIPCYYQSYYTAANKNLKGYSTKGNNHYYRFYDLYFE